MPSGYSPVVRCKSSKDSAESASSAEKKPPDGLRKSLAVYWRISAARSKQIVRDSVVGRFGSVAKSRAVEAI